MPHLVLVRHGQSQWNAENLFTGWVDVDLTEQGVNEATRAGKSLRDAKLLPSVLHTSFLKRAIRTGHLILDETGSDGVIEYKDWRLNERHYGGLQGMNKAEAAERFGADQVKLWRRSYDVSPPPMDDSYFEKLASNPLYEALPKEFLPRGECLADVVKRVVPYYVEEIIPDLENHDVVLVAAHGNSLRALVKHLESISDTDIIDLEIPTGVPRVYELNGALEIQNVVELGET